MENALQARKQVAHPGLMMVSMLLGAFVGMFSETSLNIALPKLMAAFQVSTSTIQWLVTGYMLIIGIILPLSSIITKWFTTRQVIIFALIDFMVGACISALAHNFTILLIGRMIQGIGTVLGMCALVIMFAPAIGPTLTGLILAKLSWQWIFWLFIPFLFIALIFAITPLENVGEITKPHVDVLSIIESAVGCSGLVIGASLASEDGWTSPTVLSALIIGIIVLIFYTHRQLHLEEPILNLHIFKYAAFTIGSSIVMLDFGIILSTMYLLPLFYQRGLLVSVALTGLVMLPGGIINAATSAVAGRLYDSIGAKRPVLIGFVLALFGALMLAFTTSHSALLYVICAHIILMIGCPLAMSPAQTSALSTLSGLESGDGSTIMNTMQQVIGALATALATGCLAWGSSSISGSEAIRFTNGFHYGIYFAIILIVVALLLSFKIKDQKN